MSTKIKPKFSFKLLSLFMAVLMVASSFPVTAGSAFAADDEEMITVEFKVTDSAEQPVNGAKIEVVDDKSDEVLTKHTLIDKIKNTYETNEKGEASFEIKKVDVYSYTVTADDMFDKTDNFTIKKTEDGKVEPVKVSMEYKITCKKCNGDGEIQCPVCEGLGKVLKPCEICNGTGYTRVKCPVCNGVDSAACERCSGNGDVEAECPKNAEPKEYITCTKCGGNKKIICPECNGDKIIAAKDFRFYFNSTGIDIFFKGKVLNPVVVEPLPDGEGKSQGKITYSSNNKNIAVDPDTGEVTATELDEEATITAVIAFDKENGYKAKKAEYTVTVVQSPTGISNELKINTKVKYQAKGLDLVENINNLKKYKITYYDENKNALSGLPENVGKYYAMVSAEGYSKQRVPAEDTEFLEITPAELTIIPDSDPLQEKEYGEQPIIDFTYKADDIDFESENMKDKQPQFTGMLSYDGYNPDSDDEPDKVGYREITQGDLALDNSNINKNYVIKPENVNPGPNKVKIHVKEIQEAKALNLDMKKPYVYTAPDGTTQNWYNSEILGENKNLVINAPKDGENVKYKISKEKVSFKKAGESVEFSEQQFGEVEIYIITKETKEKQFGWLIKRTISVTNETVYKKTFSFGIDTTAPKLNIKEDPKAPKPIEFVTQDESKNPVKILGRLLGFGNFFNTKIEATVDAIDDGKFASGIDENSYKMYLKLSNDKDIKDFKADKKDKNKLTLTLPNDPDVWQGNVYVNVKDKAGNELEDAKPIDGKPDKTGVMATGGNSNITNTRFMIENIKPTLRQVETKDENGEIKKVSIEVVHDEKVKSNGNDVYSGDVTFKFTAEDYESGLYNVDIEAYTNKTEKGKKFKYNEVIEKEHKLGIDHVQTYSESFSVNTKTITDKLGQAATYTIKITVADNAGNVSQTYTKTIHIDRQAPVVTKFEITNTAGGTSDGDTAPHDVRETSYGFYFKESADVTVSFEDVGTDDNWASGVAKVKIYLQDKSGAIYRVNRDKSITKVDSVSDVTEITLPSISNNTSFTFSINQDFKGQIYAMAYDAVENYPMNRNSERPSGYTDDNLFTKDGYQKPNGDIIESLKKHNATYAINFKAPETKNKDKDGTPLYSDLDNKGINLDLTVSDTYSGIKSISVEVSAPYDTDENFKHKVTVGKNAKDSGALTYDNSGTRENDWVITDTDENLATEMKNTINITNNSNDIEVKVTLVDRASHESTKSYKLSIDKTKPEIEITYKNNDVQNGKYYQDDRTATVTVRELNLSTPAQFNITALCDKTDIKPSEQALAELIKKTYDKKNFEKFHKEAGEDGKKTEYYEFIFEIPAKTQGDYEITASVTDNAGNKSDYNRVDRFSVDTTTPFITVTFDNDQSRNGNYFATKRTATITVTDRYFDATQSPVVINSTDNGDKISAPSQSGWSKQNSKYEQSCTVDFSKDGKYSFTVDTTDLSGKQATQYTVSDFIIDNTDPTIKLYINNEEVKDGENRAYIDEVMPKVVVEDTNFSQTDTKVTITPVIAKDKTNFGYESTLISKKAKYENGMTYVFNNFTGEDGKERKYDNIYNLDVSTIDKSGHTTKAQRITFSVNRYGSVYICKPNRYYAEKPVIQVEEINVNPINFKSKETYINVISSSGKIQTLKSKDLIIQKQEASNKNWYSYLYAIPSKCFDIDDVYSIKVSSKDTAKRVSTNINDANKKDIMFTVDTTNPYFEVTNYIENENIKAESKELEIALMDDTSGVASYNISFDGQPIENVETKVYENKVNFKFDVKGATALKDAKGRQLEVKITDAAGRTNTMSENDKSTFNVRISSNVFVEALATMQDFYQKTTAFWCTVAGIVAVIGVVAWIIIAKTKKKSNENE